MVSQLLGEGGGEVVVGRVEEKRKEDKTFGSELTIVVKRGGGVGWSLHTEPKQPARQRWQQKAVDTGPLRCVQG